MASPIQPPHVQASPSDLRSPWYWLISFVVSFALILGALFIFTTIGGLHVNWKQTEPKDNAQLERTGPAPWLTQERVTQMKRKIVDLDRAIPEVVREMDFLNKKLPEEEARVPSNAAAQDYVDFIRRQQRFLEMNLKAMQADRDYYVRQLNDK